MKVILFTLLLVALVFAQSPALTECIEKKCPEQYTKCKSSSGCEDKLRKCANKCGEKIAQTCWTLCLGITGAATNVALCAVNQGCITNASAIDRAALTLMHVIENFQTKNLQIQWYIWSHHPSFLKPILSR